MSAPRIGVAIPAWRAADFLGETLSSVLNQADLSLNVYVSIDGEDDGTAQACADLLRDPRVHVVAQRERLGWVRNTRAALALAGESGADFVCVQPHDDLMTPGYLSALLQTALDNPGAAIVYGDIECFGNQEGLIVQHSVRGAPIDRQVELLTRHYNAVAFRGLMPNATWRHAPLPSNDDGDFACDAVWMAGMARCGDLVRAPGVIYRKRFHAANTHGAWKGRSSHEIEERWLRHCVEITREALRACGSGDDVARVMQAAIERAAYARMAPASAHFAGLDAETRHDLISRFQRLCAERIRFQAFD